MATSLETLRSLSRARYWLAACLIVALLTAAGHYALKTAHDASAILRWRGLIEHLVRGENVYNQPGLGGSFPNPPILGLVLWPFTLMPPVTAALVWFFLKAAMAAAAIRWSIRLATADEFQLPTRSLLVLLILVGRPILGDLEHGNINIAILFLCVAGLWAFRQGRDWPAGLAISLATALKLTPALFIPYFAWKRQWRLVTASLVGLVLWLLVVPGVLLGPARNLWLLRSWAGAMVVPYVVHGSVETIQTNQSLASVLFRLLTDSPAIELPDGGVLSVNCLSLDRPLVSLILKGLFAAIVVGIAWLARAPGSDRRDWRLAAEASLVFIAMLLISERSWKHHFVVMVLPYAVVIACLWRQTFGSRMRAFLRLSLVAAFLLMASTSPEMSSWIGGDVGHKYAQAYGMFCLSALVIFADLSAVLVVANPPLGTVALSSPLKKQEYKPEARAKWPQLNLRWRVRLLFQRAAGGGLKKTLLAHAAFGLLAIPILAALLVGLFASWTNDTERDRRAAPALAAVSIWLLLLLGAAFAAKQVGNWFFPDGSARLATRWRSLRGRLALSACAVMLSLGAAELAVRLVAPTPPLEWVFVNASDAANQNDCEDVFCEFDPMLGWRGIPARCGEFSRPGICFHVEQNSAGFRDIEHAAAPDSRPRLAMLGDSFVWGFGVEQDQTASARLRTLLPESDVCNLGVCGYGTDQSLLAFDRWADDLRPARVCYLFCANDVADNRSRINHGHPKPYFRLNDGDLRLEGVPVSAGERAAGPTDRRSSDKLSSPAECLSHPVLSLVRVADYSLSPHSVLYRQVRRANLVWRRRRPPMSLDSLTEALILEMKRRSKARGAAFTLALIPDRGVMKYSRGTEHYASVREWCRRHEIDCLDFTAALLESRTSPYLFEGHWNSTGHSIAAAALAEHFRATPPRSSAHAN